MKTKDSNAQIEVWEWKEKAYNAIKDIPDGFQVKAIKEQTKKTIDWLNEMKLKQSKAA